ncbi:MAG: hypothetical protein AB1505_10420 [Candidatus Latescibacterota bacterium]
MAQGSGGTRDRRLALLCLLLSAGLHLLGLLSVHLGLRRSQDEWVRVARVRLASPPEFARAVRPPAPAAGGPRRPGDLEPRPAAQGPAVTVWAPSDEGGAAGILPGGWAATGAGPGWGPSAELLPPPRPDVFHAAPESLPSPDARALSDLAAEVAAREGWAPLALPDADTTDAESQSRARARQVVLRAIDAMGGMDALLVIRQAKARVWVEAREHARVPCAAPPCIANLPPYPFLVEEWEMGRDGQGFTARRARARISTDPQRPNDRGTVRSAVRNPARTLGFYEAHYGSAPRLFPAALGRRQRAMEGERWHFVARFLGEGVDLAYLGKEEFAGSPVEAIRVVDRKYGYESEAFFARRTGLLGGMREGTPGPLRDTEYGDYRSVAGVLAPHRFRRYCTRPCSIPPVTVHLQLACNGAEPPQGAPVLGDGE